MRYPNDENTIGTGLPNIFAFVDLLLILLLTMICSASAQSMDVLDVHLAQATGADGSGKVSRIFNLTIRSDGSYELMRKPVNIDEIREKIGKLKPGTTVIISADKDARHAHVVAPISIAQTQGLPCVLRVEKEASR
jgi:biopolymer transport protein ExbD